jgi:hypothetical protein
MNTDFTFSNALIKAYFDGSNEYVPVAELVYLHEHPLIKGSFLVQIERMINQAAELMTRKNMQGVVVERFIDYTMKLGAHLPSVNEQTAPLILEELRKIYQLCKDLLN